MISDRWTAGDVPQCILPGARPWWTCFSTIATTDKYRTLWRRLHTYSSESNQTFQIPSTRVFCIFLCSNQQSDSIEDRPWRNRLRRRRCRPKHINAILEVKLQAHTEDENDVITTIMEVIGNPAVDDLDVISTIINETTDNNPRQWQRPRMILPLAASAI